MELKKKQFTYRGKSIEELKELNVREFAKFVVCSTNGGASRAIIPPKIPKIKMYKSSVAKPLGILKEANFVTKGSRIVVKSREIKS